MDNVPWWWTALLAPLLTGALGVIAAYIAIRFDVRKTANQELIKKRIMVYDEIAPKLNDLLCFFLTVGSWKNLPPPLMVDRKRELDRAIYVYGPLFSQSVFDQYQIFIHTCFKTFVGVGQDARLRADSARLQREWGTAWNAKWNNSFVQGSDIVDNRSVKDEYVSLMNQLAGEIGAKPSKKLR